MFGRKKIKALEETIADLRWELASERERNASLKKFSESVEARLKTIEGSKTYLDAQFFEQRAAKLDETVVQRDEQIAALKKDLLAISTRSAFLEEVAKSVIDIGDTTRKTMDALSVGASGTESDKSLVAEILNGLSESNGKAQQIIDASKSEEFWHGGLVEPSGEECFDHANLLGDLSDTVSHTN